MEKLSTAASAAAEFIGYLAIFGVVAVTLFVGYLYFNTQHIDAEEQTFKQRPPIQPRTFTHTYSLLPGATQSITNHTFRKIEVRSEYPIEVVIGGCYNTYAVQWRCESAEPTDIFIRDDRGQPIFMTPRANAVTITGVEF